jgi:hypothetical protein
MATTDDLIISIRADVTRLQSQLRDVDQNLNRTQNNADAMGNAIKNAVGGLLGLGAAVEGLKKLVEVNREFGILKAGLETATGSAENAQVAFEALQNFAQTTPYDLAQATKAFTQLVNLGLTPSEQALKSYGDTSAALGKDLSQMVEAVADAATGEFERLKEFGIKASAQGDKVSFTFKGVKETVGNNAADIENYLIKLGEVNFNGAMEKRMQSLDGAISNLGDSFEQLFYNIGQSGATDVLSSGFRAMGDALTEVNNMLASGEMQGYIESIAIAFEGWTQAAQDSADMVKSIFNALFESMTDDSNTASKFISDAFTQIPENIRAMVEIGATELAYFVTMAEMYGEKIASALNPNAPKYDLKGHLKEAEIAYQESLENILNKRQQTIDDAKSRQEKAGLDRLLFDWNQEYNKPTGDTLAGMGANKGAKTAKDEPDKKAEDAAKKKAAELKKAAQAVANQLDEANLNESDLVQKHYNEQVKQLNDYLKQGAMSKEQHNKAMLDATAIFYKKTDDLTQEQNAKEQEANLKKQQEEDERTAKRMENMNALLESIRVSGLTELELMDEQHKQKMDRLEAFAQDEITRKDDIEKAKLEAEQRHLAKRADIIGGSGTKIQDLTKSFQKGQLDGTLAFFAADFGGFSQHSRKMFELNKAAKTARVLLNIPDSVSTAMAEGMKFGPVTAAAYGAAALAMQLGQLRAIQSASFGGGGGGGGSAPSAAGAGASAASQDQQQAPVQQRFVNIGLYGQENTMYSKDSVRELITRINSEVKDGAVLRVN